MNHLTVSVIVASYNGKKRLPDLLLALNNQSSVGFELIIVLDGSKDGSEELFVGYTSEKFKVKLVIQPNKGRAGARNAGAKIAQGHILVFYDDDMRPSRDSVQMHVDFHKMLDHAILGGNQIENPEQIVSDFDRYRCTIRQRWNAPFTKLEKLNTSNLHLTAANFSISKFNFDQLGGFDESLSDAEDIEFAHRAVANQVDVYFDPTNMAWHDDFVTCQKYILRQREYQEAYQYLMRLGGDKQWLEGRKIKLNIWKRLIYSFFSHKVWIKLIDEGKLIFLPYKVRYNLYTWVITGLSKVYPERALS